MLIQHPGSPPFPQQLRRVRNLVQLLVRSFLSLRASGSSLLRQFATEERKLGVPSSLIVADPLPQSLGGSCGVSGVVPALLEFANLLLPKECQSDRVESVHEAGLFERVNVEVEDK